MPSSPASWASRAAVSGFASRSSTISNASPEIAHCSGSVIRCRSAHTATARSSVDLSPLGADLGLRDAGEHRLVVQPEHVDLVTHRCCGSDPRGLRDARGLASGAARGGGCHGTEPTDRHRQFLALRAVDPQLLLKKLGVVQRPDLTRFRGSSASASEHLNHRRVTSSKLLDVTGFRGSSAGASAHLTHRRGGSPSSGQATGSTDVGGLDHQVATSAGLGGVPQSSDCTTSRVSTSVTGLSSR